MRPAVLVSGANGFIGRRLCAALRERGERVIALLRRPPSEPGPWDAWRLADFSTDLPPDIAMGADRVCHLAALVHVRGADQRLYEQVNHRGTRQLLAAATHAGVRQFVYFSSIKAAGETTPGCIDEDHPALPETAYGRSKLAAEQALRETSGIASRLSLRLCPVYGEKMAGSLRQLVAAVERGWFPPLPPLHNRRSFVHVDDVVAATLALIEHPPAGDALCYVSDGAPLSGSEIVALIRAARGRPPQRVWLPARAWRGLAAGGDWLERLSGRPMPFDGNRYRALFDDACYSNARLLALSGVAPRWDLARFLRERR